MNLEQWKTYSLAYQLGNVGAEVSRVISLKNKGSTTHAQNAFERALELLDMTIESANQKHKTGELIRLREVLCGYMLESSEYLISGEQLNNYFIPFALMARK